LNCETKDSSNSFKQTFQPFTISSLGSISIHSLNINGHRNLQRKRKHYTLGISSVVMCDAEVVAFW
jgi:hypothetical protein